MSLATRAVRPRHGAAGITSSANEPPGGLHELWWAHEIKTALAVVQMSLAALQRKAAYIQELASEELAVAEASIRRGISLVEEALSVSGGSWLKEEVVSVPSLLGTVAATIRAAAGGRGEGTEPVEVVERYDPLTPVVWGDRQLLEAAFVNLAFNSLQALETQGGRIELVAAPLGAAVRVHIRDTGPGFRGSRRLVVYGAGRGPGAGWPRGTGLGLSIARAAVQAHGGKLTARDLVPHGAEVTVLLPALGQPAGNNGCHQHQRAQRAESG